MATSSSANETDIEKVFNQFDTNNDGKISAGELTAVMKRLSPETSDKGVEFMMAEIDSDRDRLISFNELSLYLQDSSNNDIQDDGADEMLKEAFDMYDVNKDGLISAAELHWGFSELGESCTVEDCEKMIETVDSDGDGHVSFEDFKKLMGNNMI